MCFGNLEQKSGPICIDWALTNIEFCLDSFAHTALTLMSLSGNIARCEAVKACHRAHDVLDLTQTDNTYHD